MLARRVGTGGIRFGQVFRGAKHQVRPEFNPQSVWRKLSVLDGRIVQRQRGSRETKLDFAAHDPDCLFLLTGLREVRGIEVADLGGDPALRWKTREQRRWA